MKTIQIRKAQRTLPAVEVPSVSIVIDEENTEYETLQEADYQYWSDAHDLCNALVYALPGGTFDRLLIAMLERTASHFKIRKE